MKVYTIAIVLAICFGMPYNISGQAIVFRDSTFENSLVAKSFFTVAANYSSDYVYAGRKDSVKVPYFTPRVSYYHKSGLYAQASASFITAPGRQQLDLVSTTIGYDFTNSNFFAGAQLRGLFFNESSSAIQSTLGGVANAYAGYDFGFAELSIDGSLLFGEGTDVTTGIELAKYIYLWSDRLLISPSVYLMAGTQQNFSEYYVTRGTSGNGRGRGSNNNNTTTSTVKSTSTFEWMAWEFSVPVGLRLGNARVYFYPTYAIPMNPPTITVAGVTTNPTLENTFYWSIGVRYGFY